MISITDYVAAKLESQMNSLIPSTDDRNQTSSTNGIGKTFRDVK
jgi:hypothetical protein